MVDRFVMEQATDEEKLSVLFRIVTRLEEDIVKLMNLPVIKDALKEKL